MFRTQYPIDVDLLKVANRKRFRFIVDHPDFCEDAMQELHLVQQACPAGIERKRVAHRRMAWLAYELGVTPKPPRYRKPDLLDSEPRRVRRARATSFHQEFRAALDIDRIAA